MVSVEHRRPWAGGAVLVTSTRRSDPFSSPDEQGGGGVSQGWGVGMLPTASFIRLPVLLGMKTPELYGLITGGLWEGDCFLILGGTSRTCMTF